MAAAGDSGQPPVLAVLASNARRYGHVPAFSIPVVVATPCFPPASGTAHESMHGVCAHPVDIAGREPPCAAKGGRRRGVRDFRIICEAAALRAKTFTIMQ
eukprot:5603669-Pleurochrysis_carterae.AAC.1